MAGGRKRGGQPGNLNALKHGFYSKHFEKAELLDLDGTSDLQEEIGMMRVVIRRLWKREKREHGQLRRYIEEKIKQTTNEMLKEWGR